MGTLYSKGCKPTVHELIKKTNKVIRSMLKFKQQKLNFDADSNLASMVVAFIIII